MEPTSGTITDIEELDSEVHIEYSCRGDTYVGVHNTERDNSFDELLRKKAGVTTNEGLVGETVYIQEIDGDMYVSDNLASNFEDSLEFSSFSRGVFTLGLFIITFIVSPVLLYSGLFLLGGITTLICILSAFSVYFQLD